MVDVATLTVAVDSRQLAKGEQALDRLGDQAAVTERQVVRATTNINRGMAAGAQGAQAMGRGFAIGANDSRMLAMQLSQVAQQGQATGNYLQALAIQGADIGMLWGPVGIAIGVAAGAVLPLIANLFRAGEAAITAEEAAAQLLATYQRIEALDFSDMAASAAVALEEFAPLIEFLREEAMSALQRQINDVINTSGLIDALGATEAEYESILLLIDQVQAEAAGAFNPQVQALYNAQVADLRAELEQVGERLNGQQVAAGQILNIAGETREEYLRQAQAALETLDAADMLDDATRSALAAIIEAIDPTGTLRDILAQAAEEARGVATAISAISRFQQSRMVGSGRGGDPRQDPARFDWQAEGALAGADALLRPRGGVGRGAAQQQTAAMRAAEQAIRAAQMAAVTFEEVQADLNRRLQEGEIDAATYADALERARETLEGAGDATQFWQSQMDTLQGGILDAIVAGNSLADVFQNVARAIARAALEAALFGSGPLAGRNSGAGLLGPLFSNIFGGFRAAGGSVSAGRAYVVGEHGPEIFAPPSSGTILPNAGGGFQLNQTINNYAGDDVQAKTETRRRPDGTYEQVISLMRRAVAEGQLNREMSGLYGLRPQRIGR